jgi:hypothetical protein
MFTCLFYGNWHLVATATNVKFDMCIGHQIKHEIFVHVKNYKYDDERYFDDV